MYFIRTMGAIDLKLKDKKRQDILAAAIKEFREHGFAAARVDTIAERARVSKRTLYNHFGSKQALFDAIVEQILTDVASVPTPTYKPSDPLREQLLCALREYVCIIAAPDYISLSRLLAAEYMRDKSLAKRILTRPEFYVSPVLRIIEGAMKAGRLRQADAGAVSGQLLALVKNYYFWPQFMLGDEANAEDETLENCVDLILASYASKVGK